MDKSVGLLCILVFTSPDQVTKNGVERYCIS